MAKRVQLRWLVLIGIVPFALTACVPATDQAPALTQGGQGDGFTGGDSRDAIVVGIRSAAVQTLARFASGGNVTTELCNTSVAGNPVAGLVRSMSYRARSTCKDFFARHGDALRQRWSDPLTFQVVFTSEDLTVVGPSGERVDVLAETTADPHSPIYIENSREVFSDPYRLAMLILHEGIHHYQLLDDRNAGPAGYEGPWGNKRFINDLSAAIVMASYSGGYYGELGFPAIVPVQPTTGRPLARLAKRVYRDIAGLEITDPMAESVVNAAGGDRKTLVRNIVAAPEARDAALKRILERFELRAPTASEIEAYRNLPRSEASEEWLWALQATVNHAAYSSRFPTDEQWFVAICRDFFGFEPTSDQVAHHVGLIQSGEKSRNEIMTILYLQSGRVHFFRTYYRALLGRDPTTAESNTLPSIPIRGGDGVIEQLLASDDYLWLALVDP